MSRYPPQHLMAMATVFWRAHGIGDLRATALIDALCKRLKIEKHHALIILDSIARTGRA